MICGKMNIGSILKAAGLEFCDDYDSDLERFLDYMEITREIDRDKLFLFANLRSFSRMRRSVRSSIPPWDMNTMC